MQGDRISPWFQSQTASPNHDSPLLPSLNETAWALPRGRVEKGTDTQLLQQSPSSDSASGARVDTFQQQAPLPTIATLPSFTISAAPSPSSSLSQLSLSGPLSSQRLSSQSLPVSPLSDKSTPTPSPSSVLSTRTLSSDLLHSDVLALILKRPLSAPTSPMLPMSTATDISSLSPQSAVRSNGLVVDNRAVTRGVSQPMSPMQFTTNQPTSAARVSATLNAEGRDSPHRTALEVTLSSSPLRSPPASTPTSPLPQQSFSFPPSPASLPAHGSAQRLPRPAVSDTDDDANDEADSASSSSSSSQSGNVLRLPYPPTRRRRRSVPVVIALSSSERNVSATTGTKRPEEQREGWTFNEVDPRHSWCEPGGMSERETTAHIVGTVRQFRVYCCNELGMPIVDPTLHTSRGLRAPLFTVRVDGPQREPPIQPQTAYTGSGVFTVSYVAHVQGVYEVHVLVKGQHVRGSPFLEIWEANESQRTSAAHTTAMGLGLVHAVAGQETVFFVQARDAFNNPRQVGGDPFDVRLRSVHTLTPPTPSPLVKVRDYQNGTYAVVYIVWQADTYFIDVTLHGEPIQGSPFRTVVAPAACSVVHCSAQGSGLRAALVNPWTPSHEGSASPSLLPSSFLVILRDRYGNPLSHTSDRIRITMDAVQLRSKVTERGQGTYLVEYTVTLQNAAQMQQLMHATRPVRLPLNIFINDELLPGCPFLVELTLRKMDLDVDRTPMLSSLSETTPMKHSTVTPSALVRVQSIIRMHHALVLYAQLRKMYRLRFKAASELLSSEENYVRSLNRLKEEYLNPLRLRAQQGKPIISLARIALIFSNIEFILSLNTELLMKLRARIQAWSPTQVVGDIMIEAAPSLRHTYTQYVNNYDQALKTLNWCLQKENSFAFFLESKEQASLQQQMSQLVSNQRSSPTITANNTKNTQPYLSLPAFLIMPVQRLPKYELLLQELLKYTPKEHPDYNLLQRALQQIKETTNFVNENKRNAENLSKLLSIQNSIHNCISLFNAERVFLHDETFKVRVGKKSSERRVFLFNDLLLLTRAKKNPKGAAYKYKESVLLHHVLVERSPALGECAFRVVVPQVVTYTFVASSREVAEFWFRELQRVIKTLARNERQQTAPAVSLSLT